MIYNEMLWLRMIFSAIPYIGGSLDMLFYKKGIDTEQFTAGEDLNEGDNCYLDINNGKFYKTDAALEEKSTTMIVKAIQRIKSNHKGIFLVKGKYYTNNIKRGTLYLSLIPGKLSVTPPKQTDSIVRIVGTILNEKEEYFSPSQDWIQLT